MSTLTSAHGTDTHVRSTHPNRNYSGGSTLRLLSGERRGFVHVPVTDIRGRTVLSATLTGHVKGTSAAQSVTLGAVSESWSASRITWNRQPGIGATVTTALGSHTDGEAVDLDATALLQAVANGTKWHGLRLSTNATDPDDSLWSAFDAAAPSWTLTVELSDVPEQPTDLRPNQGAVASPAPIVAWSYTDLGGDASEQGAFTVQADPDADEISPAFDSGWVVSADPQYDLSSGSFTDLGSGDDTQWRVKTRDAAGNESDWSDWAAFSYEPYATLTIDSPTGGTFGDSTPDIVAHLTGETLTQWRATVLDAAATELWDSGLQDGAASITVPKRSADGNSNNGRRVIAVDDAPYTFRVRAFGDVDRADAVGLPAYVEATSVATFDEDAGVDAPTSLTVTPVAAGDPRLTFVWQRTEDADAWLIMRGNDMAERLDPEDVDVSAGVYTWTDDGLSRPYATHHWTVRAVESGVSSEASNSVTTTTRPEGVWLLWDGNAIHFHGGVEAARSVATSDRRASYSPVNSDTDIDIVYGLEGASAEHFAGLLLYTDDSQDVSTAVDLLNDLREDINARPRLVWANRSIRALLRNLSPLPDGEFLEVTEMHEVSFGFIEVGD